MLVKNGFQVQPRKTIELFSNLVLSFNITFYCWCLPLQLATAGKFISIIFTREVFMQQRKAKACFLSPVRVMQAGKMIFTTQPNRAQDSIMY